MSTGQCDLHQRFSTWGTRTPRGTWGGYRGYAKSPQGYAKFKKPHPNEAYLGRIFYLGVREGDTILIWGYASTKRLRTPDLHHLCVVTSVFLIKKLVLTFKQFRSNTELHFLRFLRDKQRRKKNCKYKNALFKIVNHLGMEF